MPEISPSGLCSTQAAGPRLAMFVPDNEDGTFSGVSRESFDEPIGILRDAVDVNRPRTSLQGNTSWDKEEESQTAFNLF